MEGWEIYKLSDIGEIVGGGTPSTKREDYYNGEISWITPRDLSNYNSMYISKGERSITLSGLKNSSAKLLPKGTILLTSRAPIGYLVIAENEMCTNQGFKSIIVNEKMADNKFVYYLIKSNIPILIQNASGSTFLEISGSVVKNLKFNFPPLKEQIAIASILSALDDKIEINLQMNKTLEEMAMALYKHWFVDFGPFQNGKFIDSELGMIPEGWEVKSIYSEANFINGAAFKAKDFVENKKEGLPVIKIVEIKQGITAQTMYSNKELDSKYIIYNNEILFPWSGNPNTSLGIHLWDKGKALLNQHTFVVRVENTNNKCFVFNTLKYLLPTFVRLASHKQTTGLGHVTVANLKELMIPSPNTKSIIDYNIEALPFFDMIYSNQIENQTLTSLRDTLLPKLISGEVRVKDIHHLVEASL